MFLVLRKYSVLLVLPVVLVLATGCANVSSTSGILIRALDGDTVDLKIGANESLRVRIAGIDAPEKSQAFGTESLTELLTFLSGERVDVIAYNKDRYGRTIAKLVILDEHCQEHCAAKNDVGLRLIAAGLAWHYKSYSMIQTPQDRVDYANAEVSARQQRFGLWAGHDPVPPWVYRKNKSRLSTQ